MCENVPGCSCHQTTAAKENQCAGGTQAPCTKQVAIFQRLSDDELATIANMTTHQVFKKGEILINSGDQTDTLFIIHAGQVKLSKLTLQGREQILRILGTGDFFGELAIFDDHSVSNFTAAAAKETAICMLTRAKMQAIMEKNPGIALKLLSEVTKRLAHTENLVQNLATKDPETRIANLILEFCEDYGIKNGTEVLIQLPLTREEMANYIGVTRETISRKLRVLENEGILTVKGKKITVKDYAELCTHAG